MKKMKMKNVETGRNYILRSLCTEEEGQFSITRSNHTLKHDENSGKKMTRHLSRYARDIAKKQLESMSPEQYRLKCIELSDGDLLDSTKNCGDIKSQEVIRKAKSELYAQNDNHIDDILDICAEKRKCLLESEK